MGGVYDGGWNVWCFLMDRDCALMGPCVGFRVWWGDELVCAQSSGLFLLVIYTSLFSWLLLFSSPTFTVNIPLHYTIPHFLLSPSPSTLPSPTISLMSASSFSQVSVPFNWGCFLVFRFRPPFRGWILLLGRSSHGCCSQWAKPFLHQSP